MRYRQSKGFALMLVIWAMIVLTGIASGFAFAVRHETRAAGDTVDLAHAEAAATAALNTAVLALAATDTEIRWRPDGRLRQLEWQDATVDVRIRAESGRVNLSLAPTELLVGLFELVLPEADTTALAHALVDWRDRDDDREPQGAEEADYAKAGYAYAPPNRPLASVHELSQVMGFDRDHIETIRPYVTVYGRQPRVNAASADVIVLAAIPGIELEAAQTFAIHRDQMLTDGGTLDYTALRNGRRYLDTRPDYRLVSIDTEVRLPSGLTWREQAVVQLDSARGYALLSRETLPAPSFHKNSSGDAL